MYPYKAMIASLLQFDDGMKKTQLVASGYHPDPVERAKWFTGSKSVGVFRTFTPRPLFSGEIPFVWSGYSCETDAKQKSFLLANRNR